MTLKQLEAFVKIANNKSFTLAARELFITQPTVSAYINNLEEELGVRVFDRTTKEVQLSEEGNRIYLYAKEMLELTEKIQSVFCDADRGTKTRQIIIATSSIPGQFLLPEILASFGKKYPNVDFRVRETDSEGVVNDVTEHKADIGFAGTEIVNTKCRFIPFYDDELILVTENSEKYRKIAETEKTLDWVKNEAFIMRESGSGTRKEAMKLLEETGIFYDDLKVKATFEETVTVINSVINGVGISMMSRLAAEKELESGNLLSFKLSENGGFRKIYMVTEKKNRISETAKDMMTVVGKMYRVDVN